MKILAVALWSLALVAASERAEIDGRFVKSLLNEQVISKRREARARQLETVFVENGSHRRFSLLNDPDASPNSKRTALEDPSQQACDASFFGCLPNEKCTRCFTSLRAEGIDWASVNPWTPCADVIKFLTSSNHCTDIVGDKDATDLFCQTFNSCVVWVKEDQGEGGNGAPGAASSNSTAPVIDCAALTECKFDNFKESFLGDGVCHDNLPGCYNTEICGFDGGDCCQDTCKSSSDLTKCGTEGYSCRNPKSENCDSTLTTKCEKTPDDDKPKTECGPDDALYRLVQYDSFGDGWDDSHMTLTPKDDSSKVIYEGGLKEGAEGTEYICLSTKSTCYNVVLNGGSWGNEVSWEIKPVAEGTKAVADGGAPMDCAFSVAGEACDRTCNGKANVNPEDDKDYKTYKELYNCIQEKCVIQVGVCNQDEGCSPCFTQDSPEFCFANDNFNAVIDCGLCQCSEKDNTEFCAQKATPGAVVPADKDDEPAKPRECSAAETLQGSTAVAAFATCTEMDKVKMMVTEFDENNFGALDQFEACAHSYQDEDNHGGRTALSCMQILSNAAKANGEDADEDDTDKLIRESIAALAGLVYQNAENFCECASKASADCPLCPSFLNFKTLLYESLDACKALDEIDCDAWNEFYGNCKKNLEEKFTTVDFTNGEQCDFVKDTCGGAGAFPAFRRLDCGSEIPKASWDLYNLYSRSCLNGDDGKPPEPAPTTPAPTDASVPGTPAPVTPPSPADGGGSTPKPYIPPPDVSPSDSSSNYVPKEEKKKRKKRHFFRHVFFLAIICGAGYYYYKHRQDSFSFVRYRRTRNYGAESEMMYSGLAMDSGAGDFQPPTLPPTPSAVDDQQFSQEMT